MYHAGVGTFCQRDPLDSSEQVLLYAYVENNPMNFTDPSGLESKSDFCVRVFPAPDPKDTSSKKTWECVLSNCLSDIGDRKKFAKCLATCGVKSAGKDVKLWIINLICCNTTGNDNSRDPCDCGLQRKIVVECGVEVVKWEPGPCQDPAENVLHTLKGKDCTDCCEYRACINGLTTIGSLKGVINSTFDKVTCDANCVGR